jgi:apolipoprotein D and lipocalin family protein
MILYVDPDYRFALLGFPTKEVGWVLARSPEISDADYQTLLGKFDDQGYDISRFKRVPQTPDQLGKPGFQTP